MNFGKYQVIANFVVWKIYFIVFITFKVYIEKHILLKNLYYAWDPMAIFDLIKLANMLFQNLT